MPSQTPEDLTTQQAADLLNVSHPYLLTLTDANEIVSWVADGERRVSREYLLAYKRDLDAKRLAALEELVALSQELGLYDDPVK